MSWCVRRWKAGERLGFLPGTLQEKVDPYLRPLYDALYDLLDQERVDKMMERNVIEVAPLAFMRGRTLNDAFIIMDEAQNTTSEQMKMFLTRLGNNAKAVITGDVTQIDLPNPTPLRAVGGDGGAGWRGRDPLLSSLRTGMWCGITWCSGLFAPTTALDGSRRSCRWSWAKANGRRRSLNKTTGPVQSSQGTRRAAALLFHFAVAARVSWKSSDRTMILYEPRMDLKLPRAKRPRRRELARFLREAIEVIGLGGEVSVLLTGDEAIRKLNRQYRHKDAATDVLSFPAAAIAEGIAGDLVISVETAVRQADERDHPLEMEIKLLLLHGLLHLAGYDHEADNGAMRRKEMRLRRELELSEGLIERAHPARSRQRAVRA